MTFEQREYLWLKDMSLLLNQFLGFSIAMRLQRNWLQSTLPSLHAECHLIFFQVDEGLPPFYCSVTAVYNRFPQNKDKGQTSITVRGSCDSYCPSFIFSWYLIVMWIWICSIWNFKNGKSKEPCSRWWVSSLLNER